MAPDEEPARPYDDDEDEDEDSDDDDDTDSVPAAASCSSPPASASPIPVPTPRQPPSSLANAETKRAPTSLPSPDDSPHLARQIDEDEEVDKGKDTAADQDEDDNRSMSSHSPALTSSHHGYNPLGCSVSSAASPGAYNASAGGHYGPYGAPMLSLDGYRPTSAGPMSLPSMRTMDAASHQHQSLSQPPLSNHAMSMAMTASSSALSNPPILYTHHPMTMPSSYAISREALARFPLPHDPRIIGSRGPKKCDETHPTCNNCKKSKRDCLGYDPVFRQQNSHIQPTPASVSPPSAPLHSAGARLDISYAYAPPPATNNNTITTLSPTSGGLSTSALSYNAAISPVTVKSDPGYDHSPVPVDVCARRLPPTPLSDDSRLHECDVMSVPDPDIGPDRMRVDAIVDMIGPPPPPRQSAVAYSEETFNDVTKVYHEMYAAGLSHFFESSWFYFTESGKMTFPRDAMLIDFLACFLKVLEGVKANDHASMVYSGVLETRIVWQLACTVHYNPNMTNSASRAIPSEADAMEVRNRVRVVEALISGDYLTTNPLALPVRGGDQQRARQFDFWYSLAEFLRQHENPTSAQAVAAREDMLARMRQLLDARENRDVLYSIAVVRNSAPHYEANYMSTMPSQLDETTPKHRLAVATKFLLDEAQVTGGTTNVVRRLSDIACRAFINPGVNVTRKS
ncbi:hypothetical protein CP533_6605 [Ophiocordyceps camponoti-saundersi (nom. inval.)]|nr:hypothetical protein CP533_6605 [Ophiocordyceps camponoti-saundersi (nom. inval.)]